VVIGLILALIAAWDGSPRARHFAWPLLFGLTALPWPAFISGGAIGELRVGLSAFVTEVLNALGEPATSTGTVIQVGTGSIGIDEACGGIRSLQTAVMVALAIGELRRDRAGRRLAWLGFGIALALAANVLRIAALALICSRAGPDTLAIWHDRVAALEMIFVLGGLAFAAFRAGVPAPPPRPESLRSRAGPHPVVALRGSAGIPASPRSAIALAAFVLLLVASAEIGTLAWFGSGVRATRTMPHWWAHLPAELSSYSEDDFSPSMQAMLQCDSHQLGHWLDSSGARRAGYILEWRSGHYAQWAVRLHNPDICLNLAGSRLVRTMPSVNVGVGAAVLPFSVREFQHGKETYYVYFLAWNTGTGQPLGIVADPGESSVSWFSCQWAEVRGRRRNLEARMVTLAIFDAADADEAEQAFRSQIGRIIDALGPLAIIQDAPRPTPPLRRRIPGSLRTLLSPRETPPAGLVARRV